MAIDFGSNPTGVGFVISFNGRTGLVVLLDSDVIGALGYTPVSPTQLAGYLPLLLTADTTLQTDGHTFIIQNTAGADNVEFITGSFELAFLAQNATDTTRLSVQAGTGTLVWTDGVAVNRLVIDSAGSNLFAGHSIDTISSLVEASLAAAVMSHTDNSGNVKGIEINQAALLITDEIFSKGAEYADDYSGNFTPRSLPDVDYVANNFIPAVFTQDVSGNTGTYKLVLQGSGQPVISRFAIGSGETDILSSSAGVICGITVYVSVVFMRYTNAAALDNRISINDDMVVQDQIQEKGLVNAADYSANFTDRSLIDKGFADSSYLPKDVQVTVPGSTSGNGIFSQPWQNGTYKEVLIYFDNLVGTASYVFPTAFVNTPGVFLDQTVLAPQVTVLSNAGVTIDGLAGTTGFVSLKGF